MQCQGLLAILGHRPHTIEATGRRRLVLTLLGAAYP